MGAIVLIIVILIIVYKAPKKNNSSDPFSIRSGGSLPQTPVTGAQTNTSYRQNFAGTKSPSFTGANAAGAQTAVASSIALREAKKAEMEAKKQAPATEADKKPKTTDYLAEKAKQDEIQHVIEKREEQQRVERKYGGQPTGMRYLLGDPVPAGMRIVVCEYCGAENLVKITYHGGCDCYFCRTAL